MKLILTVFTWLVARILDIDWDVILINNNKNVKGLGKDLINITLEARQSIGLLERYHVIFEIAISDAESRLPFVTFLNA